MLKTNDKKAEMKKIPYTNAIRCMMHVMVFIRPDLAHAFSVVSRFMISPGKE